MSTLRVTGLKQETSSATNISLAVGGGVTVAGISTFYNNTIFTNDVTVSGNISVGGTLTYQDVTDVDSIGIITARSGIDVGTGTSISSPSSNTLTLGTNNEERLRITSAGLVGIGISSPSHVLDIDGTTSATVLQLNSNNATYGVSSNYKYNNTSIGSIGSAKGIDSTLDLTDLGINSVGNIDFCTNYTKRVRIDSSGRLLVGTASYTTTDASLVVDNNVSGGSVIAEFRNEVNPNYGGMRITGGIVDRECRLQTTYGNSFFTFYTEPSVGGPQERMRIDSSGQLILSGTRSGNSVNDSIINFNILNSNGDQKKAEIKAIKTGDVSSELIFSTTATHNFADRMRIDSSGRLLVNRSTTASNGALAQFSSSVGPHISVNNTGASSAFMLFQNSSTGDSTSDGLYIGNDGSGVGYFWNYESGIYFGNNNATVGRFIGTKFNVPGVYNGTTTGGGPVYVESDGDLLRYTSSLKYKTDVETLEDERADAILNCRPVWYRSKCENDIKTEGAEKSDWGWYGFIAEEVAEIEPRLVNWATKDSVEQEDKTTLSVERDPADYEAEGVRYDNFVPLMLNLIKRQKAQIETLEQRLSDAGIA